MDKYKKKYDLELLIAEFQCFCFTNGGYKHQGVINYLFKAVKRIKRMSTIFSKQYSEKEALEELIEAALAYQKFLNENQENQKCEMPMPERIVNLSTKAEVLLIPLRN